MRAEHAEVLLVVQTASFKGASVTVTEVPSTLVMVHQGREWKLADDAYLGQHLAAFDAAIAVARRRVGTGRKNKPSG
jgi:hypothetical protein